MNARNLAAEVLRRVWNDGAFAAAALSAHLAKSGLEDRDRGLATELVYGVLRTGPYLERRLAEHGKLKQSDSHLLSQLFVAAYQLDFLDRIPARAAVHEAVEEITRLRGKRVGGFANAVLRALGSESALKQEFPQAVLSSTPSWIRKRLLRDVGEEECMALLAPARAPQPFLRVTAEADLPWLADKTESVSGVPGAFRYLSGGDPRRLGGYEQGAFVVQELGAQLVAHALGARAGEKVLDVCAGRGQKTTLLAGLVGENGEVVATDLHAHKVSALQEETARLGFRVEAQVWDWTSPPPESLRGVFDRVIVDAPCSGVGTLRRRPEIARRLGSEDPERLAALQIQILRHAALALRPGGTLLFATCSVFREEAEQVVTAFLELEQGGFELSCPPCEVDSALFPQGDPQPSFRLLPGVQGTDGYFVARFQHRDDPAQV